MGNSGSSFKKISFENIIDHQKNNDSKIILINTMPQNEQQCLIKKTIPSNQEEQVINNILYHNKSTPIYIYGKNTYDSSIVNKAKQLAELGFTNVYIYMGGLFEWLLLQEVYGSDNFQTKGQELDLLKYRPMKQNFDQSHHLHLTNFVSNNL